MSRKQLSSTAHSSSAFDKLKLPARWNGISPPSIPARWPTIDVLVFDGQTFRPGDIVYVASEEDDGPIQPYLAQILRIHEHTSTRANALLISWAVRLSDFSYATAATIDGWSKHKENTSILSNYLQYVEPECIMGREGPTKELDRSRIYLNSFKQAAVPTLHIATELEQDTKQPWWRLGERPTNGSSDESKRDTATDGETPQGAEVSGSGQSGLPTLWKYIGEESEATADMPEEGIDAGIPDEDVGDAEASAYVSEDDEQEEIISAISPEKPGPVREASLSEDDQEAFHSAFSLDQPSPASEASYTIEPSHLSAAIPDHKDATPMLSIEPESNSATPDDKPSITVDFTESQPSPVKSRPLQPSTAGSLNKRSVSFSATTPDIESISASRHSSVASTFSKHTPIPTDSLANQGKRRVIRTYGKQSRARLE